jgi:hypothetical protein
VDTIPPEALLANAPPPMREIGEWLRAVVRRAYPDALERVRPGWGLIGYDVPNGRRSTYVAFVWAEPVHVHLGFEHGALMADPGGLLEGKGITKKVRWVTLTPDSMLAEGDLRTLLHEARRVATLSRGERVAIAMARDEAEAERQAALTAAGEDALHERPRRWDPRQHR